MMQQQQQQGFGCQGMQQGGGAFGGGDKGKGKGKGKDFDGDGKGKGGKGKVARKIAGGEPCFAGTLRQFVVEKKSGLVSSEVVYNMTGSEVYAHEAVLQQSLAGVGDTLVFFVHWSTWGQPQVSYDALRIACAAEGQYALKGMYKVGNDPSKEFFGRDTYVHKDMTANLMVGQTVAFNIKLNKDMMPQCMGVMPVHEAWEPTPGDLSMTQEVQDPNMMWMMGGGGGWGGDKGKGKGKSKKPPQGRAQSTG